ncbi:MAG: class I SAM-dependent methyltransferase [Mogibacterium sp.]|nr:class I SAM-dependent methyltransferase [Mogibacterium sp.]
MHHTLHYYNQNAEQYFRSTVHADLSETYGRFLRYLAPGARILDAGCGSGRDAAQFVARGFDAEGLDASEELAEIAGRELGVRVHVGDMTTWIAEEPYDGIWCCAALLHLEDEGVAGFFRNLRLNLRPGGVLYVSVKEGIETGTDEKGRYMRNFTEEEILQLMRGAGLEVPECWSTADTLDRGGFRWVNAIGRLAL